uniref:Uncharacterized protein n=1 Tax=Polysiphonia sp. TaxID=1967842 RepID=A0A1Z1M460_9FLOR|nr:hypothetical protein [Polysiphonia sp.]
MNDKEANQLLEKYNELFSKKYFIKETPVVFQLCFSLKHGKTTEIVILSMAFLKII